MKPAAASILALAISLASSFALASPEGDAKENVKIEKKEEVKPKETAKDAPKDVTKDAKVHKPSKHHARTVSKGRAHSDKAPSMVAASARQPATTKQKDAKPAKTKKVEKKGDQKHPAGSPAAAPHASAIETDPGAMDHQGIEHHAVDRVAQREDTEREHAEPVLPTLPPPGAKIAHTKKGSALENVSAHEPVAQDKGGDKDADKGADKSDMADKSVSHKAHGKDAKARHDAKAQHDAKPEPKSPVGDHAARKPACVKPNVDFSRGTESDSFPLLQCDGTVSQSSLDRLSILLRPASVAKPTDESKKAPHKATEIAPSIMKIDSGLAARLEKVMDHFKTDSHTPKVSIVSGYRPASVGSFHSLGRAIDFRLDGIDNAKLVEFCKTLPDTGCGFYPNSSFVHMDVRDGKASWIDASGPGEAPRYVTSWPPPANPDAAAEAKAEAKKDDVAENKLPGNDAPTPENTHP
jgi:uncharacterized protein YcbK (DUF882 family)